MTHTPQYNEWPKSLNQMPTCSNPKALDWGMTGGDSVLLPGPTGVTKKFYGKNLRQLFSVDLTYALPNYELSSAVRSSTIEIPVCWDQSIIPNLAPGQIIKAKLGWGMAGYQPGGVDTIICPLGIGGEHGIVRCNNGQWDGHYIDIANTYGWAPDSNKKFLLRVAVSTNYIFVCQQQGGIAVYDKTTLVYRGHLQLPTWQNSNLQAFDIVIRPVNGRDILAISVAPYKQGGNGKEPKALFYLPDDIVSSDLATTYDFTPSTPANTAAPIGVVFGEDPNLLTGQRPKAMSRIDLNRVLNSSVALSPSGTTSRTMCALGTPQWTEVYDVTRLVLDNAVADATENPASNMDIYSALSAEASGLDIDPSTPCIHKWLDSFAISSTDDTNCGPPVYSRTNAYWPYLKGSSGYSVTLANQYLAVGIGANPNGQGNGLHLLAMTFDSNMANFGMAKVGIAQTQLGMGNQDECFSRFQYDVDANWLHGSIRATSGWTGFRLPPQTDAGALIATVITPNGEGKSLEPSAPGSCPPWPDTGDYLPIKGIQSVQMEYMLGPATLPISGEDATYSCDYNYTHAPTNFPANLSGWASWNIISPPGYPNGLHDPPIDSINTHGGFEFLGGSYLEYDPYSTLFFADRSSNTVYAFSEAPGEDCKMLDSMGHIPSPTDVATGPSVQDGISIVLGTSRHYPYIKARYWDQIANQFGASIGNVPICLPWTDDSGDPKLITEGFRRIVEIRNMSTPPTSWDNNAFSSVDDNDVSHVMTLFAGKTGVSTYQDKFEIAITPINQIDNGTPDSNNNISTTSTLWRFKRSTSPGTSQVKELLQDGSTIDYQTGVLEVWDAVQVGDYVFAWVNEHDSVGQVNAHWIATLKLTWTVSSGTGNPTTFPPENFVDTDVTTWTTQGDPKIVNNGAPVLSLEQVNMVRLTNHHIHDAAEGNRLTTSEDGMWLLATGGAHAGAYLLYLGNNAYALPSGYPKVVAGLMRGSSPTDPTTKWRGWPYGGAGLVSDELPSVDNTTSARAGVKPEWPLDGTATISFTSFPSNCGAFHQSNGRTYLFLQTEPMTVWEIDHTAATNFIIQRDNSTFVAANSTTPSPVLQLVGALETVEGRFREVVVTGSSIYWVGDAGCVAVTLEPKTLATSFNTCGQGA